MLRRHLHEVLLASLEAFPVVLLVGARQVGKSTLAQAIAGDSWGGAYVSLDERLSLDAALADPDGFVRGLPVPVVIDEVQRAPDLLRAVKVLVDRDRTPGRFLLTGSADVTTLAGVSETLAGRVAVHVLRPLSASEVASRPPPRLVDALFETSDAAAFLRELPTVDEGANQRFRRCVLGGGYPTPALMNRPAQRRTWFESYRQTYVERDLRGIADIHHIPDFGRLITMAALRTAQLLNANALGREVGLPYSTLRRYLAILEQTFQIEMLQPFAASIGKRLVRAPKLYVTDSGMAADLAAVDGWEEARTRGFLGALVETWAHAELRKILPLASARTQLSFYRAQPGAEVDFLLERGEAVVGIEVKLTGRVDRRDRSGLRSAAEALGSRWRIGVIAHGGTDAAVLDERTLAVPMTTLFAT